MFAFAPLAPAVVLPVLAVGAAIAGGFLLFSAAKPKSSAGILGHLQSWNQSPELQLAAKALASRIATFGETTGHQILDAVLLKMAPWSAPFLPTINATVGGIEKQLAGGGASIVIPSGHPILDLLQKTLEARQAHQATPKGA